MKWATWQRGLWVSVGILATLAAGIFYWRVDAVAHAPLWAYAVAAVGLAGMLFAYMVLVVGFLGSIQYQLLRLSCIDPLFTGSKIPTMQAAQCGKQAAQILNRATSQSEDKMALDAYMSGLSDGFYALEAADPIWTPGVTSPGRRWTRSHLLKVRDIGYRHGSVIRCAFNKER